MYEYSTCASNQFCQLNSFLIYMHKIFILKMHVSSSRYNAIYLSKDLLSIFVKIQYWSLLNWHNLRFRCGCVAAPVNLFFDIISSCFSKFKNVVHSLEPGETPLGVSPGSKLCAMFLNIAKYFKTLRCGCGVVAFIFSIYLKPVLYLNRLDERIQMNATSNGFAKWW